MQKCCQLVVFGAAILFVAGCSTTPPAADGSQAKTERVCVEEQGASGSRLSRRVCRRVPVESERTADEASQD